MALLIVRTAFLILTGIMGWLYAIQAGLEIPVVGLIVGALIGAGVLAAEYGLHHVPAWTLLGGGLGFLGGLLVAGLAVLLSRPLILDTSLAGGWRLFLIVGGAYLGAMFGAAVGRQGWPPLAPRKVSTGTDAAYKILDTSVIIDGRIADVCTTGFVEGTFIVPQFILKELQHIADSSDSMKRARGRRGLDILNQVQKMSGITIKIIDEDFPQIREVDAKIVALAKRYPARIVTNDLNLNKVAALQGVKVLNINELSNALKPVVLPGEGIRVFILKEGKESGQGVAYLDDGTMIVVDEGKRFIGKNADVIVTSVLQTTAGRMIFTRLKDEHVDHLPSPRG